MRSLKVSGHNFQHTVRAETMLKCFAQRKEKEKTNKNKYVKRFALLAFLLLLLYKPFLVGERGMLMLETESRRESK